jgi:hypothetical protein
MGKPLLSIKFREEPRACAQDKEKLPARNNPKIRRGLELTPIWNLQRIVDRHMSRLDN